MSISNNQSTDIKLAPGDEIIPGYTVVSNIGEGACGAIYCIKSTANEKVSETFTYFSNDDYVLHKVIN